ncbi:MAG TPA: CARDB domain-containing protein [Solirubrobacteraceae bacterium]|nr:CARDB domain-containing protein [Solirubrobacteraceae bacterium]
MRRTLLLVTLIALFTPAASTSADATPGQTKPPPLEAALETCLTSPLPVERVATFVGAMPAVAGADHMRVRFDLERRQPGQRYWRHIQAPGFGTWERSASNVAGFVFRKRVNGLWVPASYRARVRFQWIAKDRSIVKRANARTPVCVQPDLRPNLVPGPLTAVLDAQPGIAIYTLLVRNTGRSAASAFGVRVGAGGAEVASLEPGEERLVTVLALACSPGQTVGARVDADRRVEESVERGNATRRRCPLPLG